MTDDSFNIGFGGAAINSYDTWGIKVISHDVFSPQKRSRKRQIPGRDGLYDYGGVRRYDERRLSVECQLTRYLSKAEFREIVYEMSKKIHLYFWDEPEKYYVAELYDSVDVAIFPQEAGRTFSLPFICEPFAYGEQISVPLNVGVNPVKYIGTAETPTLITIRNPGTTPITGIILTLARQAE